MIMPSLRTVSGISRTALPKLFEGVRGDRLGRKAGREGLGCLVGVTGERSLEIKFDQPQGETATMVIYNDGRPAKVQSHFGKEQEPALALLSTLSSSYGCFRMDVRQTPAGLFVNFSNGFPLEFSAVLDGGVLDAEQLFNLAAVYRGGFYPQALGEWGGSLGIISKVADYLKASPYAIAAAAKTGSLGEARIPHDFAFFWSSNPELGAANLRAHFDFKHQRLAPGKTKPQDDRCGFFRKYNDQVLDKQFSNGAWLEDVEIIEVP